MFYHTDNLKTTTSAELDVFHIRLAAIESVIKYIQKEHKIGSTEIEVISNRLNCLKKFTHSSEILNTGGQFEWVDSKIVSAIKTGEFISLEHVNLCSSAILDRLNSVFEPNGKLLLAEKGVTKSGKSEIVQKHGNFRAYLTLDPKNGEISRAMRNRCIELSFNKETYTTDDFRQLIFNAGVTQTYIINCLIRIHIRLKNVSEFTTFGVSHIIKTAFLTASHQNIGYIDIKAIYASAIEVYVRSSLVDLLGFGLQFYRSNLHNEICTELKSLTKFENTFNFDNIILKPNKLNDLTLIKLQCEPFLTICRGLISTDELSQCVKNSDGVHNLFDTFLDYQFENSEKFANYLLYHLYESSSFHDIGSRKIYIGEMLQKLIGVNKSKDNFIKKLQHFNNEFYSIIYESRNVKLLKNIDLPWNTKLFPRLRDYNLSQNLSLNNQLKLSAQLIATFTIENIATQNVSVTSREVNVITYSRLTNSNKINDKYNCKLLQHLYRFLFNLPKYIKLALVTSMTDMEYNEYVNFLCALLWCNRIYTVQLII